MATIGIVDYGMGNLRSVAGAIEKVGHEAIIAHEASALAATDKLVLPGVGAFGDAMRNLRQLGLDTALDEMVRQGGKPLLGICLGSQLVARDSDEFGRHEGFGWLPAYVRRIEPRRTDERVPHVGWDDLTRTRDSVLYEQVPEGALFYYVHSHCLHAEDRTIVAGECDYAGGFAAVLQQDNIYATQFHPEKSQQAGLRLLGNFIERG